MNVITAGTFDIPHYGHMNLVKWSRNLANDGKLWMALNSNDFVYRFKNKKPIMTYHERYMFWSQHPAIDEVIENSGCEDFKKTIYENIIDKGESLDLVVIGSDWHDKDYLKQMGFDWDWLRSMRIGICYVPYTQNISSTLIRARQK